MEGKSPCLLYCEQHPHTVERLAAMEKGLESLEDGVASCRAMLEEMRKNIANDLIHRYPATILWVISLLTGFCTALLTVVLGHYLK